MRDGVAKLRVLRARLAGDGDRLAEQRARTERERRAADEALAWVNGVIEGLHAATHERVSSVVSKCLAMVFGEDAYQFAIEFGGKGKVRFALTRGGESFDLDDQVGGGVLDVAAFALRLAAVTILRTAKVLVLDEPFRFVSKEYRPKVVQLLDLVSKEFGVQIIQVTHAPELVSGRVVEVR